MESHVGWFTGFKKSRLEKKFRKNDWIIIQPIPFSQFEQLIIEHVEGGWEIEDDYERLEPNVSNWHCELRKGTSILTCIWMSEYQGLIYGPKIALASTAEKLGIKVSKSITHAWF